MESVIVGEFGQGNEVDPIILLVAEWYTGGIFQGFG
jgi:hypothetical protein